MKNRLTVVDGDTGEIYSGSWQRDVLWVTLIEDVESDLDCTVLAAEAFVVAASNPSWTILGADEENLWVRTEEYKDDPNPFGNDLHPVSHKRL